MVGFLNMYYEIHVQCSNCGATSTIKVRKGIAVSEFVKTKDCRCDNCGVKISPKEYSTEWLK